MNKIIGYKINTNEMKVIEEILKQLREMASKAANEVYHKLLSTEVEEVVDNIVLNVYPRPECSILEVACDILEEKINYSSRCGMATEYNLSVTGFLMFSKNYTFLEINCGCAEIEKAIKKHKALTPIYISDKDKEFDDGFLIKDLVIKYSEYPNLGVNIYISSNYKINKNKLKFSKKSDRVERKARHDMQSHLINMYACGREIQKQELMRYMDLAFKGIDSIYAQENIKSAKSNLDRILPEITFELISESPEPSVENTNTEKENTV